MPHVLRCALQRRRPCEAPRRTTVLDVGCNKGYFSGIALNYLAPGFGNHLQLLYTEHIKSNKSDNPCGSCNDCQEPLPKHLPSLGQAQVDVYCYEPSTVLFSGLTTARDTVYGPPESPVQGKGTTVRFNLRNKAVSNRTGTDKFPTDSATEVGSLGEGAPVNVTTLDAELSEAGMPTYLDVLKIDAEGFDPTVMAGAYHLLRSHRVGLLTFEYHSEWNRSGGKLRLCLDYLEELGYSCYFDGPRLVKLSGCWHHELEIDRCSNVVCAVQGSAYDDALFKGSFIAQSHGVGVNGTTGEPVAATHNLLGGRRMRARE
ncbi:hypothetical protein HXX76_012717 [Chlamydomonas incerta]|uniref:Methyltransferase FkbM domain-containing protein n=1 Tax=Chlamydomonas incerta TaxID=51695 RepID=A0A835SJX9_CHLIN|nr:hypothetical protein HXX76_012717 [Chlamydomonas incerta]|eukprot:KAG2426931.1 hypothetical protein HXX76_012717 [Chlamydomonas incerta]